MSRLYFYGPDYIFVASISRLGLISDPLMVSKFLHEINDSKGQEK